LAALGFTEDVNLANAESMNKQLWMDTVIPQLDLIKRQLNHQLASEFGSDFRLSYDLSNVTALSESLDKKLESADRLYRMGVPFNVVNQHLELGLEDIEGGDIGYIPSGLIPASFDQPMEDFEPGVDDAENGQGVDVSVGDGKVQDEALNGAQISSLSEIVQLVASGDLPLDSAIGLIAAAFPALSDEDARAILTPAASFTPRSEGEGAQ